MRYALVMKIFKSCFETEGIDYLLKYAFKNWLFVKDMKYSEILKS